MNSTEAEQEILVLQARAESEMELGVCAGCTACALRCASDVPASRAEWAAIQAYIQSQTEAEQAHLAAIQSQDKTVDLGDGVTVQMCRYWDTENSLCAVYPVRPLVCRLLGHVEWMPCPIEKVSRPLPLAQSLQLMQAYARLERKTFDDWEELGI
jgi:Fe-S-cluster containining protein